jgi:hypothetical protein
MGHASRPASARVLPWDQTSPEPTRANGKPCPGVSPIRAAARMPEPRTKRNSRRKRQTARCAVGETDSPECHFEEIAR